MEIRGVPAKVAIDIGAQLPRIIMAAICMGGVAECGQETEGLLLDITVDGASKTAQIEELALTPQDGVFKIILRIPYAKNDETWRFVMERMSEGAWHIRQMCYVNSSAAEEDNPRPQLDFVG